MLFRAEKILPMTIRLDASGLNFRAGPGLGVSAIKPYEGFGDVDHTIKELMSL
jgi:hypothetical protein